MRGISKLSFFHLVLFLLVSCSSSPEPMPYLPPTSAHSPIPQRYSAATQSLPTPTLICSNDLVFLGDLTIPDYTIVAPGASIEKQWRVQNIGSCRWDYDYSLRLVGGSSMGAEETQVLFPASAGSEVTISLEFTSPLEPGEYTTTWQAYDPSSIPFGPILYMTIIVQP